MRQVLGFYFEGDPLPLPVPPCLTPCLLSQLPACLLCCWSPSEVQTCLSVRSALHHGQPTETDRLRFWRDTHTHSLSHTFWTRTFFYFQTVTFLKVRRFLEGKLTVGWSGASPHHTLSQLVGVDVRLCFTQAAWTADSHTPLTKQVSSRPAFIRKGTKRNCGSRERKNKLSLRASPLLVREKTAVFIVQVGSKHASVIRVKFISSVSVHVMNFILLLGVCRRSLMLKNASF